MNCTWNSGTASFTQQHESWKVAFTAALLLHAAMLATMLSLPDLFQRKVETGSVIEVSLVKSSPVLPVVPDRLPQKAQNPSIKEVVVKSEPKPEAVKRQTTVSKPESKPEPKHDIVKVPEQPEDNAVKVVAKPVAKSKVEKHRPVAVDEKKSVKRVEDKKSSAASVVTKRNPVKTTDDDIRLAARIAAMKRAVEDEKLQQALLDARLAAMASSVGDQKGGHALHRSGGLDAASVYGRVLKNRIRSKWFYPSALFNAKDLKVTISISIARDGALVAMRFEKRSGNALFDASVERAIKAAEPFPPLPDDLGPGPWEAGFNFDIEEM